MNKISTAQINVEGSEIFKDVVKGKEVIIVRAEVHLHLDADKFSKDGIIDDFKCVEESIEYLNENLKG